MGSSLGPDHLTYTKHTRAKDRPDIPLIKYSVLLVSLLDFFEKGVIKVLVKQGYLVEGGAKSILKFGIGSLHEEDVLMLIG